MKTKSIKKKLVLGFILIALIVGVCTGFNALSFKTYAHFSDYQLKYLTADYGITDDTVTLSYTDGETEQTLTLPHLDYYDFEPEYYQGRVKQALIEDQSSGLLTAKLIEAPSSEDLPPAVRGVFEGDVLEVHYYKESSGTMLCLYAAAGDDLEILIAANTLPALSAEDQERVEGKLDYMRNFAELKPLIYDLAGNRIDNYTDSYRYGPLYMAAKANDYDPDVAAACEPGMFDAYTVNDNYSDGSGKNLWDYRYGSNQGSSIQGTKTRSDDIVQLVPIELFRQRGQYVYVGKEYGFFVETDLNIDLGGYSNRVDVGIFDIKYTDDEPQNLGAEISSRVEVRFLYSHSYIYLTREDTTSWEDSYDSSLTEIVTTSRFEGTSTYFVHNVSFGATIYDEIKPNPGEENYFVEKDTAAHLIQGRYNFYGSSLESSNPGKTAYATTKFIIGKLGKLPTKFGKICKVTSKVMDIAETLANNDPLDLFNDGMADFTINNEANIAMPEDRTTYCRGLAAELDYPNQNNIALLRTGQRAEMIYVLGNYYDNWTRIYHAINVTVSRFNSGSLGFARKLDFIGENGATHARHVQDREAPELTTVVGEQRYISILPDGMNRFLFTPAYGGQYRLTFNGSHKVNVTVRDASKQTIASYPNCDSALHRFVGGERYYIDVSLFDKEELGELHWQIAPKEMNLDEPDAQTLAAGESWVRSFTADAAEPYRIDSGNTNVEIIIESDENIANLGLGSQQGYFRFGTGVRYSVILMNHTDQSQDVTLQVTKIPTLALDTAREFTAYIGTTYFVFQNDTTANRNIVFTADGVQGISHTWDVKTSSWNSGNATIFTGTGVAKSSVAAGEKIYVGLTNGSDTASVVSILASLETNAYTWQIDGQALDGRTLKLKRGASATVGFTAGNVTFDSFVVQNNEIFEVLGTDTVHIKPETNLTALDYLYAETITDFPLIVKPLYECEFDYTVDCGEILAIKWGAFKGLNRINLTLYSPDFTKSYSLDFNNLKGAAGSYNLVYTKSANPYDFYSTITSSLHYNGWENCVLRLNYIEVTGANSDRSTWKKTFYNNSDELQLADKKFTPLFGGGSGTPDDPYLIGSVRHLYNIRYRTTEINNGYDFGTFILGDYKLTSNINLSTSYDWTPLPYNFRGTLDGAGCVIRNMKITISAEEFSEDDYLNFGLFEQVSGTVKNLRINNMNITGSEMHKGGYAHVGAIAGSLTGSVQNCSASAGKIDVKRHFSFVGGLVGSVMGGTVTKSSNQTDVYGQGEVGGIAGVVGFYGVIQDCQNSGGVYYATAIVRNGFNNAGGIVGRAVYSGAIKSCVNTGVIYYTREQWTKNTELAPCMGLIAGYVDDSVSLYNNETRGGVVKGSLYAFTKGALWWKESYDQARNCKAEQYGYKEITS